jgi:hypothetical protein
MGEVAALGAPTVTATTASGSATTGIARTVNRASGAPDTPTATASGIADVGPLTASGSPQIAFTATGQAGMRLQAYGTPPAPQDS